MITTTLSQNHDDIFFMTQALVNAQKAFDHAEVPIGAVVVDQQGVILGQGFNQVESKQSQMAHAECEAIAQATALRKEWRLSDCWIYVSLEPCAMCLNLILLSRIARLVYGARSPIFGFQLDYEGTRQVYRANQLEIVGGVEAHKATLLLQNFFKARRKTRD